MKFSLGKIFTIGMDPSTENLMPHCSGCSWFRAKLSRKIGCYFVIDPSLVDFTRLMNPESLHIITNNMSKTELTQNHQLIAQNKYFSSLLKDDLNYYGASVE